MCCAFRCAITAGRLVTSSAGISMRHRAGATTGAETGRQTGAGGIGGIAGLLRLQRFCRTTSGSTRVHGILGRSSSKMLFGPRITATSRARPSRGNIFSNRAIRATFVADHKRPARYARHPSSRHRPIGNHLVRLCQGCRSRPLSHPPYSRRPPCRHLSRSSRRHNSHASNRAAIWVPASNGTN